MTLENKITYFLMTEWESGNEAKREAVEVAWGYMDNISQTISEDRASALPDYGLTATGLIKDSLVGYVDAYANDEDLTDALKKIIEAEKVAA